jgi:hypothetical protein
MLEGTHDRTGAVGGAAVPGQHHTGVGEHLQHGVTEAVAHQQPPPRVTGRNRIGDAAERDPGLITHRGRHSQHRRIPRRYRSQPLGLGQRAHRGGDPVTAAFAPIQAHTQPVQPSLRLVGGDLVAQGARPALGDHPGGLFHRPLAPCVIGRAHVDTDRVMARDRPKRHCNRPLCGWATVDIRSKRHRLLSPPSLRVTTSRPSTRCG